MDRRRGWFLTLCAILFAMLAVSNFTKPLGTKGHFVFFGARMSGLPNDILGPLFGVILLVYAIAIWRMLRFSVPLSWAYAAYVVANMLLFAMRYPHESSVASAIVQLAVGIGVPLAAALVLTRRRAELA